MNLTLTIMSLHFLLLALCARNPTVSSTQLADVGGGLDLCGLVNCVQGTCVHSNESLLGVDCQCFPGWMQLPLFPTCVLPNCTLDLGCGKAPPPPPPPPLFPINISDPCYLVWCGDGNCVANETGHGHSCQCNDGSANIIGDTSFACLTQCSLGADCHNVGLGHPPPPWVDSSSPGNGITSSTSGSIGNGLKGISTSFKISTVLTAIVSAALHFASQCRIYEK